MKLNLNSIDIPYGIDTIVCIDYDNKAQNFGKIKRQSKDDLEPLLQNIQLYVFQGPDPSLSASIVDYPTGTVVYELPPICMKRSDLQPTPQLSDNQIVMFITAVAMQHANRWLPAQPLTVYIASGGDKRYAAVQQLANFYLPVKIKLIDSNRHSIFDILPSDRVCAECGVVFPEPTVWERVTSLLTIQRESHHLKHVIQVCNNCGERYCVLNRSDSWKHQNMSLFSCCARSGCRTYCSECVFVNHVEEHRSRGEVVCNLCSKDQQYFLKPADYIEHMLKQHGLRKCSYCSEFVNVSALTDHNTKKHADLFVKCVVCGVLVHKLLETIHYNSDHQGHYERCMCGVFTEENELHIHLYNAHPNDMVVCPLCPTVKCCRPVRGRNIIKHMKKAHDK